MEVSGYTDLVPLGRGGFSTVYRARQLAVDREVAVKVLSVDLVDEAARIRFRRECATNGRVGAHPGIVTVYDSGFTEDGHPFLSMQLCPAGSLGDTLRHGGPLPVAEVLHTGVSIAAALAYAHSAGVLHRDIKPENILLSEFGEPLLADFGIATVDDQRVSTATAASFTINHAAPECLAGAPSSPSSDVYALCSTLYSLLAGRPPFVAATSAALVSLLTMVMNDPPAPLSRPDIPPSLQRLLLAGLAKEPLARPADAHALGVALQQVQAELGLPVTPWVTAPAAAAGPAHTRPAAGGGADAGAARTRTVAGVWPAALPHTAVDAPGAAAGAPAAAALIPEPIRPADPTQVGSIAPSPAASVTMFGPAPPPIDGRPAVPPDSAPRRRGAALALTVAAVVVALLAGGGLYYWVIRPTAGAAPGAGQGGTAVSTSGGTSVTGGSSTGSLVASTTGERSSTAGAGTSGTPSTAASSSAASTSTNPATTSSPSAPPTTTPKTIAPPPPPAKTVVVTTTATKTNGPPKIDSFAETTFGTTPVDCSSASTKALRMAWSAPSATTAWLGVDSGPDASAAPFQSDLPPVVGPSNPTTKYVEVPFACSEAQHSYTLTVQGPSGKTSRMITLLRGATPGPPPTGSPPIVTFVKPPVVTLSFVPTFKPPPTLAPPIIKPPGG